MIIWLAQSYAAFHSSASVSSAIIEPDPVPVEDVIEAVVAADTSAPPPGTNHRDINNPGNVWIQEG